MHGKQNLERTTVAWVSPILLSQSTVALISRLLTMTSREPASQCSIINVRNRHASSISRLLLLVKAEISLEYSYLTDPPQNKSETGRILSLDLSKGFMLKSQKLKRLRQKQIACIGNAGLERENRRCCRIIAKRGVINRSGEGVKEKLKCLQSIKHPNFIPSNVEGQKAKSCTSSVSQNKRSPCKKMTNSFLAS
ncbi:hypothetical protein T01_9609 [Trichinella spiralis]|uniref:Uncharacterized protein n=1 Tax=Trichinella spiralis TaxID=6334 RepID=A0A0V1BHH5_TRISP|nr:hypothetical protein T01_9609 [Trichinella spiralis]